MRNAQPTLREEAGAILDDLLGIHDTKLAKHGLALGLGLLTGLGLLLLGTLAMQLGQWVSGFFQG